jgi:MOSC domain-containing protein YiiM
MSTIKGIAIKSRPREAMQLIDSAQVSVDGGIRGDFRGQQRGRQVTILSEEAWRRACAEIGVDLPWTTRRANLLVDRVEFDASWVGRKIRIGAVELVVTEETEPCARMDAQHPGLTAALASEWRGGVCCDVVHAGEIGRGDRLEFT